MIGLDFPPRAGQGQLLKVLVRRLFRVIVEAELS